MRAGIRLVSSRLVTGLVALGAILTVRAGAQAPSAAQRWPAPKGAAPMGVVRAPQPVTAPAKSVGADEGTLLDEVGRLKTGVTAAQVAAWKRELAANGPGRIAAAHAASLHVRLGEYALAAEQEPEQALAHFRAAQASVGRRDRAYGLAAYDTAITLFYQRAYHQATLRFRTLLHAGPSLCGFSRRNCALWQRRAGAVWGYHAGHAKLGIPEPERLDSYCAAASLAHCFQSQGKPADRAAMLRVCRVTGTGSSLQDLLDACAKVGLAGHTVTADSTGLQRLPKPLVAYVERDHFVAVLRADAQGVTYTCSDCGCWPGTPVHLTWKQWRALDSGPYLIVSRTGDATDRALQTVAEHASGPAGVRLASAGSGLRFGSLAASSLASLLKGHVFAYLGSTQVSCGTKPGAQRGRGARHAPNGDSFGGDPVNLVTGEEHYQTDPDLVVYNPNGPTVTWTRMYESLRGPDTTYQSDDYGIGWSHSYNVTVYDPSLRTVTQVTAGLSSGGITPSGTDAPAGGAAWDIMLNGTVVASSQDPQGWTVAVNTGAGNVITFTAPPSAPLGTGYEVRATGNVGTVSATFDLGGAQAVSVCQGAAGRVPASGTQAPGAGTTWQVLLDGTVIASSAQPAGWRVSYDNPNDILLRAPLGADLSPNYAVRAYLGTYGARSGVFSVIPSRLIAGPGAKYLILGDGSRVGFSAPAVPSESQPVVHCTVETGRAMAMDWNYVPGDGGGRYVITLPDGTRWVTTLACKLNAVVDTAYFSNGTPFGVSYCLERIVDRVGNGLFFQYSRTLAGSGFPVLLCIHDLRTATPLLRCNRATDGTGNLLSITDVYGRSVYYHVGSYSTTNVPLPDYFAYQELDQVSQVVPTGTASPPVHYAFGYQNIYNGEIGTDERVPFLHTITIPSPTGTGTSTATINYQPGTCYVQSTVDANGTQQVYTAVDTTHTQVTTRNALGIDVYTYTSGFDGNFCETTVTDGNSTVVLTKHYGDPNDPYAPDTVTDATGITGTFTWDRFGHLLTAKSPRQTVVAYTWDYTNFPLGRLVQVQGGNATPTTFDYYEPSGLLQAIHYPRPGVPGATVASTFTYDAVGNILTVTGPGNNATATFTTTLNYTTDGAYSQTAALGRPVAVSDNLGNTSHFRYDTLGRLSASWDAQGNRADYAWDIADAVTAVTLPPTGQTGSGRAVNRSNYLYAGGPLVSRQLFDESGILSRTVNYAYDPEGMLLSITGDVQPVAYAYDGAYRLKSVTHGGSATTQYTYNAAGYPDSVLFPGGGRVQYSQYDPSGRLLQVTDDKGTTWAYTYSDAAGRLTDVKNASAPALNIHLTYDGFGRVASRSNATELQTFAYDDTNLPVTVSTTYTGLPTKTIAYGYYPDGSLQQLGTPAGNFTYAYDAGGRLTGLTNPYSESYGWSYLPNGWLSSQTSAGAAVSSYTFDAQGQLATLTNRTSQGTVLSQWTNLTRDGAGNLTSQTATISNASGYSGRTDYTYDSLDRVTGEQSQRSGSYNNTFSYDSTGNLTQFKGQAHTYNSDNQDAAYTYDGAGNPTLYRGTQLTYDAANRLTAAGTSFSAGYTAGGLRAWKETAAGRTYYLYAGTTPVAEMDGSGNVTAVNTWGARGLLSRRSGGSSVFYTFDPQGNVTQRLDGAGSVLSSHMYDAYGGEQVSTSVTDPFGFGAQAGYYTDRETGLNLLGYRYYDAGTGRFLTRDPLGYAGGLNLYAFCDGNPVNGMDPLGLKTAQQQMVEGKAIVAAEKRRNDANDPWLLAGAKNTLLDVGMLGNQALGMGTATGTYAGNPEPKNILPMVGDVATMAVFVAPAGGMALKETGAAAALVEGAEEAEMVPEATLPEAMPEEPVAAESAPCDGGCFVAGTMIRTETGDKPIEQVREGDRVLTADPDTGQQSYQRVSRTYVRYVSETYVVESEDGRRIETTEEHPFYVEGRGFIAAKKLNTNDQLRDVDGHRLSVLLATLKTERKAVYNFTVPGTHTYFAQGIWVHNPWCPKEPFENFDAARRDAFERAGMANPEDVEFGMEDSTGTVVEFHGPHGAKVAYDGPHADMDAALGHDLPHVGWQTAGKRGVAGAMRGNNTYLGPPGPAR